MNPPPSKRLPRTRRGGPKAPVRTRSRPFVLVNMAMTADGKIATQNRSTASFGSSADHDHLLELRATVDAVLCGATTAADQGITLGPGGARFRRARLQRGLAEYNLRVVASGGGRLSPASGLFRHSFSPIIVLTSGRASRRHLRRLEAAADHVVRFGRDQLDLRAALEWLHRDWGVRRLLCEGGGELNQAMFRAGLVDELHLTICPILVGGRTAPTVADGPAVARLAEGTRLRLRSRRRRGDELFLVYEVVGSDSRVSIQRARSQRASERRLK